MSIYKKVDRLCREVFGCAWECNLIQETPEKDPTGELHYAIFKFGHSKTGLYRRVNLPEFQSIYCDKDGSLEWSQNIGLTDLSALQQVLRDVIEYFCVRSNVGAP